MHPVHRSDWTVIDNWVFFCNVEKSSCHLCLDVVFEELTYNLSLNH
jgi:hypothetical protein